MNNKKIAIIILAVILFISFVPLQTIYALTYENRYNLSDSVSDGKIVQFGEKASANTVRFNATELGSCSKVTGYDRPYTGEYHNDYLSTSSMFMTRNKYSTSERYHANFYQINTGYAYFDTSSIPDNATITSAKIGFNCSLCVINNPDYRNLNLAWTNVASSPEEHWQRDGFTEFFFSRNLSSLSANENIYSISDYSGINKTGKTAIKGCISGNEPNYVNFVSLYQIYLELTFSIPPTLQIISPSQGDILSEGKTCIPSISVSDPDGDTLTCKYYIDSVEKEVKTIPTIKQTVDFNALDVKSLSEGAHVLEFEVSDGYNPPVKKSVSIIVDNGYPVLSNVDFSSDDTSVTILGTATDTVDDQPSLQYRYTVGSNTTDWMPDSSYTVSSLQPGTQYNAKIEVKDKAGHITGQERKIYTKAQIPQTEIENTGKSSVDIRINDKNSSTVKYMVMVDSKYVSITGDLTVTPEWLSLEDKKLTVIGLSPNTQYIFKIKARNGEGIETVFSPGKDVTTLSAPPQNISLQPTISSIKISWDSIEGYAGYEIEADGEIIDIGTTSSYIHEGLQPETSHTYRVRTRNSAGPGEWSDLIHGVTLPNPPESPVVTNEAVTQSTITITWDAVSKADGYDIEMDGNIVNAGKNTSYIFEYLTPATIHKYRVRAKNMGGSSEWSTLKEIKTLPFSPEVPKNLKAKPTAQNITLNWDGAERAEGYEVELDGNIIDVGLTTNYVHDGLSANTMHNYRVRAWNQGGKSEWSDSVKISTWPDTPAIPSNIMATAENASITLTWYSVSYAESYDVQIDGKDIASSADTTFTDRGLTPGTIHTYRVRAKNISGEGQWSSLVQMGTLPEEKNSGSESPKTEQLANIAAVVTNKSVTISWQSVEANSQYEVEVDGEIKENGKDTVYSHTGLEPETFHTYRIRVKDINGKGPWCAALSLSTLPNPPDAPKNINAFVSDTQIELKWEKSDGTSYELEVDGIIVEAGEGTGYIDQGLTPGTSHTYRVRGKNISGVTAWSDAITKSTTSPTYEVNCVKNRTFNFVLMAANVKDFSGARFTVNYNPDELEVVDMCEFTLSRDIASGKILGTNLIAVYTPGKIEFTVDESINPGTSWSGELSTIVFKSKIDGKVGINFNIK